MQQIRHELHTDHLVIEIGQHFLERFRLVAIECEEDLIDALLCDDLLQSAVVAQHRHAGDLAVERGSGVGQNPQHAKPRLGVPVDPPDDLLGESAAPHHHDVSQVVAAPTQRAERQPDACAQQDRRGSTEQREQHHHGSRVVVAAQEEPDRHQEDDRERGSAQDEPSFL